jgi:hypothetical protein
LAKTTQQNSVDDLPSKTDTVQPMMELATDGADVLAISKTIYVSYSYSTYSHAETYSIIVELPRVA